MYQQEHRTDQHDVGWTHVALKVADADRSVDFYQRFAQMQVVHRRSDADGATVVWLSDLTRPFVLVLIARGAVPEHAVSSIAHLGIGCESREALDRFAAQAAAEGCLRGGPTDSGYPIGYWAMLSDPDGYALELSFGQEVALTVNQSKDDRHD